MNAESTPAAQEAVTWLSKDEAQLALFKAIQAIRFGNPTDDKLILANLREAGLWIGRYAAAPVAAAPVVDGRDVRAAIAGIEGSVAVGSDGEWVSVRRTARDAAVTTLRNVSSDCAYIYAAYAEAKASTPAAPGIDLATAWAEGYRSGVEDERISESNIGIAGFGAKIEPARANPYMTDASPKSDSDAMQWAISRWNAEVCSRPLANIHRRSLDDAWRQVIRRLGGDDVTLCGPRHDDLLTAIQATKHDIEVTDE